MSIKIIGGEEIKMGVNPPPVTPLDFDYDDEDYEDEEYDENDETNENDVTLNNIYFMIVIALLLMILYRVTGLKNVLNEIFAE